ncbi:MAG: aminotransferase class V-fold PLP-dependent enzyme [Candidatus Micrarchaeia archaeon]
MGFNAFKAREDFPLLQKRRKLVYFDNACTTLKPMQVIDAINNYYLEHSGCAGRSQHALGNEAEQIFEESRKKVARFVNAKPEEVVWTRNATEALNLVLHSLPFENERNTILTTNMEHHSALLPCQKIAREKKLKLDFVIADKQGIVHAEQFKEKISEKTRVVVVHHTTNTTATKAPLKEIIRVAHDHGALVLVDAAQGAPHSPIDFHALDADFMAFSGHKMCGPTGIGVLCARKKLLEEIPPFLVGGETVKSASLESAEFLEPPHKFEAGIQHYAGAAGLAAACDYLSRIGMRAIEEYEEKLAAALLQELASANAVVYGPTDASKKGALAAFNLKGAKNPHEVAIMLDKSASIAVRSGMFCAQPAVEHLGAINGAVRASLYFYNTLEEVSLFGEWLKKLSQLY